MRDPRPIRPPSPLPRGYLQARCSSQSLRLPQQFFAAVLDLEIQLANQLFLTKAAANRKKKASISLLPPREARVEAMDVQPAHRSRRSFPNLQHLSLAPLSSRFPLDGDDFEAEPDHDADRIRLSYIQGKSAPTTPSILAESRNSSRPRSASKSAKRRSAHGHEHYFSPDLRFEDMHLPKAKSAVGLVDAAAGGRLHHARRATGEGTLSPMHTRHVPRESKSSNDDDEWLHRAGMIMSAEARENKGQSWLVSRDSSTSLVAYTMSGEHLDDDVQGAPTSPYLSRTQSHIASHVASRVGSRAPSARTSRRGSLAAGGSRVGFMTSMDGKTPGSVVASEGYFDDVADIAEPDFVDPDEDGIVDDEEVSRLAKQKSFGFGRLIDRMVGFSLFNVDEDAEEVEDDESELSKEEALKRKQAALKRRREELAKAAESSAYATRRADQIEPAKQGEEGGWQDAAWLLSVASKVLY
ncbi:uncharacterized protein PV09_03718 [Verruconis gallopava]|uniref:EF-hand domain-containing protein n=1 Tax=Verruconis gallopava TaxID=253628 RepID=A0A0D1YWS7_9PEZI|nr:uncharacterized protein PV09_03718 [Verruconis gallopava]KIW05167.1 hypothetical protein PV09_03718 [Verruconis gallopava]